MDRVRWLSDRRSERALRSVVRDSEMRVKEERSEEVWKLEVVWEISWVLVLVRGLWGFWSDGGWCGMDEDWRWGWEGEVWQCKRAVEVCRLGIATYSYGIFVEQDHCCDGFPFG